jgi:hypothetical protein
MKQLWQYVPSPSDHAASKNYDTMSLNADREKGLLSEK